MTSTQNLLQSPYEEGGYARSFDPPVRIRPQTHEISAERQQIYEGKHRPAVQTWSGIHSSMPDGVIALPDSSDSDSCISTSFHGPHPQDLKDPKDPANQDLYAKSNRISITGYGIAREHTPNHTPCPYRESLEQSLAWTGVSQGSPHTNPRSSLVPRRLEEAFLTPNQQTSTKQQFKPPLQHQHQSQHLQQHQHHVKHQQTATNYSQSSITSIGSVTQFSSHSSRFTHSEGTSTADVSRLASKQIHAEYESEPRVVLFQKAKSVIARFLIIILITFALISQRASFVRLAQESYGWWFPLSFVSHGSLSLVAFCFRIVDEIISRSDYHEILSWSIGFDTLNAQVRKSKDWKRPLYCGFLEALAITLAFPAAAYVPGSIQQVLLQIPIVVVNVSVIFIISPGSMHCTTQHKIGTLLLCGTILMNMVTLSFVGDYDNIEREYSLFYHTAVFALAGLPTAVSWILRSRFRVVNISDVTINQALVCASRTISLLLLSGFVFFPGFGDFNTQDYKEIFSDGFSCVFGNGSEKDLDCNQDSWKFMVFYVGSCILLDFIMLLIAKIHDGHDLLVVASVIAAPSSLAFFQVEESIFGGEAETFEWFHYASACFLFLGLISIHLGTVLECTSLASLGKSLLIDRCDWKSALSMMSLGNSPIYYPVHDAKNDAKMNLHYAADWEDR